MDKLSEMFLEHHKALFATHGATPKGVDWNDYDEMLFRYSKIISVIEKCPEKYPEVPTVLDVGCGWGGLYQYCLDKGIEINYTGIDIVPEMIDHCHENFDTGVFLEQDIFNVEDKYDFVVCNAILTQKLAASIPEMEKFSNDMLKKMLSISNFGVSTVFISNRVNFMVPNLYYRSPSELLSHCLVELTPRVVIDHGYSSLQTQVGKYYDFMLYLYR
ncbi:MAG: methyltransferase domain-containing protein [Mariprofundaceae bacterium]